MAIAGVATNAKAAALIATWGKNPEKFVLDAFGPGYEATHQEPLAPDPWQKEALQALVEQELRRFAFAASKNALKTCTLAWVVWWFLVTRYDAQIIATSVSRDNLSANLWKELATWYALSPLCKAMFDMSAESITAKDKDHRLTWWCKARGWPKDANAEQQKETLAGLHSKNLMFVGDEAGGIPDGVVAAADAIFASKGADAYLLIAGNTVRQAGPLYRAVQNQQGLFWVKRISGDPDDPNRCTRVSIDWAKEQLAMCGGDRNHPHYKINVLGEFPDVASDKLLGPDDVDRAMRRAPPKEAYVDEPIIIGIDTALQGTDQTAVCIRQGPVVYRLRAWRTQDSMVLADQLASVILEKKPAATFLDLGGPSGHAVRDRLKQLGFPVIGVDFGSEALGNDPAAPPFANRRAEMAWRCAQWVKQVGALPEDQELRAELLEPSFWPAKTGKTRFLVEPKAEIKERLNRSPDRCDSLWLTFAASVYPKGIEELRSALTERARENFDPFARLGGR